jgi:hypothetical protein
LMRGEHSLLLNPNTLERLSEGSGESLGCVGTGVVDYEIPV